MKRLVDFLWCTLFILAGYIVTLKLSPQEIKADVPNRTTELTIPKINSVGQFDLLIDLNNGKAKLSSNKELNANVTVNHKTVEIPSKPQIKKEIVYVTKAEYLTKTVMFSLPTAKLHVSSPQIPHKVER